MLKTVFVVLCASALAYCQASIDIGILSVDTDGTIWVNCPFNLRGHSNVCEAFGVYGLDVSTTMPVGDEWFAFNYGESAPFWMDRSGLVYACGGRPVCDAELFTNGFEYTTENPDNSLNVWADGALELKILEDTVVMCGISICDTYIESPPTPQPFPPLGGSCVGFCGEHDSTGDCVCDEECTLFADCCADICTACEGYGSLEELCTTLGPTPMPHPTPRPTPHPTPIPTPQQPTPYTSTGPTPYVYQTPTIFTSPDSCEYRCGWPAGGERECSCTNDCFAYDDCCGDVCRHCEGSVYLSSEYC